MNSEAMYSEIILDYYRNPKQFGTLDHPHIHARDTNPSCGDVIEFFAHVDKDVIKDVRFTGKGCAISQASASMLAESLVGKHVNDITKFSKQDVLDLLGIPISGMRMKCALLGLKVLKVGTFAYLGKSYVDEDTEVAPLSLSPSKEAVVTSNSTFSVSTLAHLDGGHKNISGQHVVSDQKSVPHQSTPQTSIDDIKRKLRLVVDPEMHLDVVTLDLIRDIKVEGSRVKILMTLTSPLCPFGDHIVNEVKSYAAEVSGVSEVTVDLTFDPPWVPSDDIRMMLGV